MKTFGYRFHIWNPVYNKNGEFSHHVQATWTVRLPKKIPFPDALQAEELAKEAGVTLKEPESTPYYETKGEFIYRCEYLGRSVRKITYEYVK